MQIEAFRQPELKKTRQVALHRRVFAFSLHFLIALSPFFRGLFYSFSSQTPVTALYLPSDHIVLI